MIGTRPWNNTSASFDAIKFRYQLDNGQVDGAYTKISDEGTARVSNDDTDFAWIYGSFNFGQMFQEVDVYLMHQDDDSSSSIEVNTLGFRIKGSHGDAFFRTENGIQHGSNLGKTPFNTTSRLVVNLGCTPSLQSGHMPARAIVRCTQIRISF